MSPGHFSIWQGPFSTFHFYIICGLLAVCVHFAAAWAFEAGSRFAQWASGETRGGAGSTSISKKEHDDA